jgi:ribonuclease P protein component
LRYRTVKRNNDFARAYKRGRAAVHPQLVMYVNKNREGHTRVGITASKKTGGAVRRNRARRVIRHALYRVLPADVGGYDLVFVARGQTAHLKSHQLAATLNKLFERSSVPALEHLAEQNRRKNI